ncbi:putative integral membrane protein [Sphingomonas vulcanisoli]|uniref:Integral membrane protein n=1 Tax=Sphingomonas vulcanisoli TaxID=1658060 RepID=A0ABX0TM90_9SPHN|nr:hypothetical protein [Sphingomonas vulcanisoli]NIJ06631.1 putative integral membrane protein [Sphingomonas vulcanisoli]
MNFLRTLFWIVVTVVVVVFSVNNWTTVTINLWGGLQADSKLPLLLLIAFLIGFVPLYIWHRAHRWQTAKRVAALETVMPVTPPTPASIAEPPLSDTF